MPGLTQALSSLEQTETLLRAYQSTEQVISNYPTLLQGALLLELTKEISKLREQVFPSGGGNANLLLEAQQEALKKLCGERDKVNRGSALSFQAMPEGRCNQLYWNLVMALFEPATLADSFSVLFPEVTKLLTLDATVTMVQSAAGRQPGLTKPLLSACLATTDLSDLKGSPDKARLSELIVCGDEVLDVSELRGFSLIEHTQLFTYLKKNKPKLFALLYEHNDAWRQVALDVTLSLNQALSPRGEIALLQKELKLSGERYSRQQQGYNPNAPASHEALTASARFSAYLDRLPETLRTKVLALSAAGSEQSVAKVMAHLGEGKCVETAAQDLQAILSNAVNAVVLNSVPSCDASSKKVLTARYKEYKKAALLHGKKVDSANTSAELLLDCAGREGSKDIPECLSEPLLQKVRLSTAEQFIDLVINLPVELYKVFLGSATVTHEPGQPILPEQLAEALGTEGFFTEEQRVALVAAILTNQSHLALSHSALLFFAVASKSALIISQVVAHLKENSTQDDFFALLCERDSYGYTALHWASRHPESLKAILQLLPEGQRLEAVKTANKNGSTVSHWAARHPESLKAILESLPKGQRLEAVQIANWYGDTVLHEALTNPELLKAILQLLPEEKRLEALKIADMHGNTAVCNAPIVSHKKHDPFTPLYSTTGPNAAREPFKNLRAEKPGVQRVDESEGTMADCAEKRRGLN